MTKGGPRRFLLIYGSLFSRKPLSTNQFCRCLTLHVCDTSNNTAWLQGSRTEIQALKREMQFQLSELAPVYATIIMNESDYEHTHQVGTIKGHNGKRNENGVLCGK